MPIRFTPTRPYLATLVDNDGRSWQFAYGGSMFVQIREVIDDGTPDVLPVVGANGSRDDWPFSIGLIDWAKTPETVTTAWLDKRSGSWIVDRNEDIAAGNITD